eukprot:gnl/MRDRNA2_/MRDRNA2_33184_c0_seq1.p1 gnl/MRDRNA2_/MRDRNA2_33184_c0~~gnl/MRDRNA2_/MRDRNA2_33184_c0_seq1.p1  ORF type:complete len:384 (+),score=80.24 gnl/MRDRNA2_/MRDRNA2_33184_c0_seq1:81-1232(+)
MKTTLSRLALAFGVVSAAAAAALAVIFVRRRGRRKEDSETSAEAEQLAEWCANGTGEEPVVEVECPVDRSKPDAEWDAVEIPVGLLFECDRLREAIKESLEAVDDRALVSQLRSIWEGTEDNDEEDIDENPAIKADWLDIPTLAQLTYWYDRRPPPSESGVSENKAVQELAPQQRQSEAKYGRWTKKVNREQVIYGAVALKYKPRSHLGQPIFVRPAGVDVTRLVTLKRAAEATGHAELLQLVEDTMEKLRPKNIARIPWSEVKRHTSKTDCWVLIDGKVYDVTPFVDIHPGGGHLIVEAAGKDATSMFEKTHGEGLRYSLRLLNQFFIGVCDDADGVAEPVDPDKATPEFLALLRSITGALHTFDEAKATGEAQGLLRGKKS